jgi:NAD(P)-dependent dehydrogenase (short-subunit alcohol dehydrogenase family)
MFDLRGKAVLVVGGAGYLSKPTCQGLAEHGADVMVADLNKEALERQVDELKHCFPRVKIGGVVMDVGDEKSIQNAVAQTVDTLGRLNVLINATYLSVGKLVEELTGEEFDHSLHINVTGAFLLTRQASKHMNEGGAIVLYSSMYGQVAPDPRNYPPPMNPNPIEYGVAKAGLEQMVRYLAVYWAKRNIRVNGVAPGAFPHQYQRDESPEWMKILAARAPLGRLGCQSEVAGAVLFLVSDEASFITGHIINVDGGWTVW